jgi:tRNA threonylcarbamoyladenosine biosynthesis protein TsaE
LEEAYDIGYEEYIDSGFYCFIEWPEKIASLLPPETVNVNLQILNNNERSVEAGL